MNKEVIERWIQALRSGEYKQATGWLRKIVGGEVEGYCCLGVLQDTVKDEVKGAWGERSSTFYCTEYCSSSSQLTYPVVDLLGLKNQNPILENDNLPKIKSLVIKLGMVGENPTLTRLNDLGATFAEIADVLEEQLEQGSIV